MVDYLTPLVKWYQVSKLISAKKKAINSLHFPPVLSVPVPSTLGIFWTEENTGESELLWKWKKMERKEVSMKKGQLSKQYLESKDIKKNGCPILQIYVYTSNHAMK